MKVVIADHALAVIDLVAKFVELKNTPGSGNRYAMRFKKAIKKLAVKNVQYPICHYSKFASLNYSCSHFNDWVIAFKIKDSVLTVHEIIHGSILA